VERIFDRSHFIVWRKIFWLYYLIHETINLTTWELNEVKIYKTPLSAAKAVKLI
jgi:hypothetical protein